MKKNRNILLSVLLIFTMLVMVACGSESAESRDADGNSDEPKVLKLGHIAPPGTAYDIYANTFKDLVEAKTDGRYVVEIYPAGQLGVDRELMESLQVGNVDLTVITASDINQFVADMAVQDLPYLFKDWDHVEKFLDSDTAKELYQLSDSVGMTTLSFMPRGFRHVTSNLEPINTPDDLKGLKVRVAESEIYIDTFKALGANAQAMAWGEVFTALQQGTIDAHENTIITTRDYNINEVQKYMSETGHFFAFAALQMNTNLLNSMSDEDQAIFRESGIEAGKAAGLIQKENEAEAKAELESKGMIFNEVADKSAFQAKMTPVYDNFFKEHDRKIFDEIQAL